MLPVPTKRFVWFRPVKLTLESAVEFINDDELVEITPKTIRLRKRYLKDFERKRAARAEGKEFA